MADQYDVPAGGQIANRFLDSVENHHFLRST